MIRAMRAAAAAALGLLVLTTGAAAVPGIELAEERVHDSLDAAKVAASAQASGGGALVANNFQVLGHANLGGGVPNGDVWFYDHGGSVGKFAYVGT